MKKVLIAIAILAVAAGGVYLIWLRKPASAKDPAETATAKVERGAIRQTVNSTGSVIANFDVDIKCKAGGQVIKLPFDVSDTVKKGELIVELDPIDEQRNVALGQVTLRTSQSRLQQAKLDLKVQQETLATEKQRADAALLSAEAQSKDAASKAGREKYLLDQRLTSTEEYESANTAAVQAEANLQAARIRLDELKTLEHSIERKKQDVVLAEAEVQADQIALSNAEQRLTDTKVMAPMDGVVAARDIQVGQIISSGISNVGGGTTILTLSDLSRIFALADVDESDIGKVRVGQPVIVTVDAYPRVEFRGEAVRIATRGVNSSNVVTFEVKIEVTSGNKSLLKPEMTANVAIILAEKEDALLVPSEAITFNSKDGKREVTVVKTDGAHEDRPVEVGINDGAKAEIVSGLSESDTVLARKSEGESRWKQQQGGMGPMMRPPGR